MFFSKLANLQILRYSSDDPTKWFNKVGQFFEYQFLLEGEANQWWQWLH